MSDGQQQAVLADQTGRRSFRQRADFTGTLEQFQQPQAADPAILQAYRQPRFVKQAEGLVHALSSSGERFF
jgi:hypothetical protein